MQFGVLEKQRPSQAGLIFVMSRFNRSKNWSGAQFVSERSSVLVFLPGERRPPRPGVVMPRVQAGCASSTRDGELTALAIVWVSSFRPREHDRV